MVSIKKILSAASVGIVSIVLMGCVNDPYSGGGYDGYYGGSTVIYSSGPRYDSRRYRDDRYYRDYYRRGDRYDRPSRRPDYQYARPDNRPNTRPDYRPTNPPGVRPDSRPDRPQIVRPTNNSRGAKLIESDDFIPLKRGPR